jgi:integrase
VFLTWHEVLELASWMPVQIARIVPVAALTGAREGELFALRARDVDFDDETLLVVALVATVVGRRGPAAQSGRSTCRRWRLSSCATSCSRAGTRLHSSWSGRPRVASGTRTISPRACSGPQFTERPKSIDVCIG